MGSQRGSEYIWCLGKDALGGWHGHSPWASSRCRALLLVWATAGPLQVNGWAWIHLRCAQRRWIYIFLLLSNSYSNRSRDQRLLQYLFVVLIKDVCCALGCTSQLQLSSPSPFPMCVPCQKKLKKWLEVEKTRLQWSVPIHAVQSGCLWSLSWPFEEDKDIWGSTIHF